MSTAREEGEPRRFGALWMLTREYKGEKQVLTLKEIGKEEVAAGFSATRKGFLNSFSFPGGGRSRNGAGKSETLRQTIENEVNEELGFTTWQSIKWKTQLPRPFIVGQLVRNPDYSFKQMNQFAATSVHSEFDGLSHVLQQEILKLDPQNVRWVSLFELFCQYQSLQLENPQVQQKLLNNQEYRPQVLAAAYFWMTNQLLTESPEVDPQSHDASIYRITEVANRQTHKYISQLSSVLGIPINNGAFNQLGFLLTREEMGKRDADFLGLKGKHAA